MCSSDLCPPRPEQLIDGILAIHEKAMNRKQGKHRETQIVEIEHDALQAMPVADMKGLVR